MITKSSSITKLDFRKALTIKTVINKYLKIRNSVFALLILEKLPTIYVEKHYFINYQHIMMSV